MIPLGILGNRRGGAAGAYELISTAYGTGSSGTITFASLETYASTYKHLQIRFVARGTGTYQQVTVRLNGDSANNYAAHRLMGSVYNGTGSVSSDPNYPTSGGPRYLSVDGSTSPSNAHGSHVVDFLDVFSTAKNKTVRSLGGYQGGGNYNEITLYSGVWLNTASVTQIDLVGVTGNFTTTSRFSLYGIRG